MRVTRRSSSVLVLATAILLVVGTVAPSIALLSDSAAAAPNGMVGVPDDRTGVASDRVSTTGPPDAALGAAPGAPGSDTAVSGTGTGTGVGGSGPPPAVVDRIPKQALQNIRASQHASSLTVEIAATQSGGLALVLTDEQHSAGREVAVPTSVFEQSIGRVPALVFGVHEDGSRWREETSVEDGYVVFDVPHFSTNTVSFSGSVTLSGTYTNGSTVSYNISDLDAASDPNITFTGIKNNETDSESASGVTDGGSVSLSVAGNLAPSNATVTVEPAGSIKSRNPVSNAGDGTIENTYTGYMIGDDSNGERYAVEIEINPDVNGTLTYADFQTKLGGGVDYIVTTDIYVESGSPDGNPKQGKLVATKDDFELNDDPGVDLVTSSDPGSYNVTAGNTYHISVVTTNIKSNGASDYAYVENDDSSTAQTMWYGKVGGSGYFREVYGSVDYRVYPPSKGISITGSSSVSFGDIYYPNSKTKTVPIDQTASGSDLDVTTSNGKPVDLPSINYTEYQVTDSPSVAVNGKQQASVTGTLSDGTTKTFTGDKTDLVTGENNVTVSLASSSSDAPPNQVTLDYSHDAKDKISTDYTATKWQEEYNVSKTYASDRSNAELTIPHEGNVVAISRVEKKRQ